MSERERIAYEELKPGDVIQDGDEWQTDAGRWKPFASLNGSQVQVRHSQKARRPYKISTILEIGDALADAQKAATQLQDERDEACKALTQMLAQLTNQAEVLAEVRTDEKRLFDDLELLRSEYIKLQNERDEAQAALKSAQRARDELQLQVDELREQQSPVTSADQLSFYQLTEKRIASLEDDLSQVRADRDKLQGLIDDLLDEPTARQVQDMLRTWATELDWSADCFDSEGRGQINSLQRILIAVMERIEGMINPEAASANA